MSLIDRHPVDSFEIPLLSLQTGHAGPNNLNRDEESNSLQFSDKGVCLLYLSVAVLRIE